jgi:photosystem II stability/assembly factor-like uncharacterized protein
MKKSLARSRVEVAVSCLVALFFVGEAAQAQAVWRQLGPADGLPFVTTVAFDPQRADIAYAGLLEGGLASSTNGGLQWAHQVTQLDGQIPLQVVSSAAQAETLYALTDQGVFRSTGAGTPWTQLGTIPAAMVGLACDPKNPNLLYIWGLKGLYRSTDAGVTWSRVSGNLQYGSAGGFAIDPQTPSRLYLGARSNQGAGLFLSTDSGAHWKKVANQEALSIVVSPADPSVLWATHTVDLVLSHDRGAHWSESLLTQDSLSPTVVLPDESDANVAYLGRFANGDFGKESGLLKTVDGGRHWRSLTSGLPGFFETLGLAQDPRQADHLLLGTDTGLFQSIDAGSTWSPASSGLVNTDVTSFAASTDGALFAATAAVGGVQVNLGGGLFRSRNGGKIWREVLAHGQTSDGQPVPPSFAFVTTDPNNAAVAYAGTRAGATSALVWKTVNGGRTWTPGPVMPGDAADLVIDPRNSQVLYLATNPCCNRDGEVFKSTDGGASWQGSLLARAGANEIAMDPTNPDILYVAAVSLFKSTDAGASWTLLPVPAVDDAGITNVTVAPSDPQVVVAGDGNTNHVYRSEDGGATWTTTEGPAFPGVNAFFDVHHPLAIGPRNSGRLYAATGSGVEFLDVDGSWQPLSAPQIGGAVSQIGFLSPTCLLAATGREGLFSFGLDPNAAATGGPVAGCGPFEPHP